MRGRTGRTCALALVGAIAWAGAAHAKTFEVTRSNDPAPGACKPNDCSLREAVQAANARAGADVIVLANARKPYKLTIAGDTADDARDGDLDVTNDQLSIRHPGRGRAEIRGVDLADRLFDVFGGAPLQLKKLKLTGGAIPPGNGAGGAIRAAARVAVQRSVISGNTTDESGGAISSSANVSIAKSVLSGNTATSLGGAVKMEDTGGLRVVRSTFRNNRTESTGGAIRDGDEGLITIVRSKFIGNEADSDGGAIRFSNVGFRIVRSSFAGNRSTGGDGGAIQTDVEGPQVIKQTTIAGNAAAGYGGGLQADGGGEPLRISSSTFSANHSDLDGGGADFNGTPVAVTNSTFAGNRADQLGGGINADSSANVNLNAVTIARNRSGADDPGPAPTTGGGIYQIDSTFEVRNTLIGLNTNGIGGIQENDCEGDTFTSLGNNLLSTDVECDGFTQPTDLIRSNPKIGKLRKNGGPTKTIALKKGSAAIGHAHKPSAPNRDQRGRKRDRNPDTGAYERGA
jgi:CSLREA domain-containing protein